jgi:3-deoxy-D-manno-octulosonic-acid transferase
VGNVLGVWRNLYRAAWALARAAWPLARLAAVPGTKLQRALDGRRAAAGALAAWAASGRDAGRPLVWFHAASVGEGRQAEAVIRLLAEARPDWQLAFTHTSASAEALARGLPVDVAGYVPADTVADTAAALDALRPDAIVFAAHDLWPELVLQARCRGARIGLISATLSPTSSRQGPAARALLGPAYAALDTVGAIDPADAQRLVTLGCRPEVVTVTGDTRHDSAAARVRRIDRRAPVQRALTEGGAALLVAGSTWESDERVLLPAVADARTALPLRFVIAPHEPSAPHLESLEVRLVADLDGPAVLHFTALERLVRDGLPVPAWDVCVVDRVGVLAELYAAATLAFVGGGFHGAGLHSVIEPAALGVPVLFGPRWQSSRDARLLLDAGGATSVADAGALAAAVRKWAGNDAARAAAGAAARAVVDAGLGAADRSLALVLALVERPIEPATGGSQGPARHRDR